MGILKILTYDGDMPAQHINRIERLNRLECLLPSPLAAPETCPDTGALLAGLATAYGEGGLPARRRALQRDLEDLVRSGRIAVVSGGQKPYRYRRLGTDGPCEKDPTAWEALLGPVRDLLALVPLPPLEHLWQRLLMESDGALDESRLRIVPDALRLQPVALYTGVLKAVVEALVRRCVLQVQYRNAKNERSEPILHPLALVQRGPIPYLFALKNEEVDTIRLYALHRMTRAEAKPTQPARERPDFTLDRALAEGKVDFGQGETIDLELRVRGDLADVLPVCPLAPGQRQEDEPEGSEFLLRVWAQVPATGHLLRWLLGAGANVEVVAPAALRATMAAQALRMTGLYGPRETAGADGVGAVFQHKKKKP